MFKNLHEAIELISEGGVQVMTLLPEEGHIGVICPASTHQYQGKVFDQRGIRTLIQLDADHVTILSPVALSMPELLKRHSEAVQAKLNIFEGIKSWIQYVWIPIFIVFEFISIFFFGRFFDELGIVAVATFSTFVGGLILYARAWLARASLRLLLQCWKCYARYRFKRFVSKQQR